MAIEYFPRLSQDFSQLLDDAEDCDIIIRIGENSSIKEFHAHSIILKSRSPYFKTSLSQNWITKIDNVIDFNKPNISPIIFGKTMTNLSNWNKNDFKALKGVLNQFIAHIRFFEISTKEFYKNIWPLKKVLPEALFEDIVSFYMTNTIPNQHILTPRHGKSPKEFIARNPKDVKYNFNLIYRGSRDGYDTNIMRNKCDGQGACILIIKTNMDETIIGVYDPLGWSINCSSWGQADCWSNTTESFLFSLGNGKDLKNFKISRVVNSNYAIYENIFHYLPLSFGDRDLVINNNAGTCNRTYYESSILDTNNFTIEEMEIHKFYKERLKSL
ncbi:995_t:CDS:2 [Funneliformis mosseae]|uniref:995_t:CDS:1 n=1 Tax=Funneliformis mosseae TaxID=27381 RepID=A0A9N9I1P0_FUNMO|nr:995_t:CDS:2 [Funneliformis mosseae]